MPRRTLLLTVTLCLASCLAACSGQRIEGGSSQPGAAPTAPQGDRPDITLETITERINGRSVRVISVENEKDTLSWTFFGNEPKEINVVEKRFDGDTATITIDMKTRSGPRTQKPLSLEGRLRLHFELETGLVLRQWQVVRIENVSFKYRKEYTEEPKPSAPPGSDEDDESEPDALPPPPPPPATNRPANQPTSNKPSANKPPANK